MNISNREDKEKEPLERDMEVQLDVEPKENQIADQISIKEFADPFTGSKNTKA